MAGIDEQLPFHPINIAVLTISDTRDAVTDTSGALLAERLTAAGHHLAGRTFVADEVGAIQSQVKAWVADPGVDVIVSTGGTGFSARDVTPEAVRPLLRREMDGFSVVFHQASARTVGVSTLQSRAAHYPCAYAHLPCAYAQHSTGSMRPRPIKLNPSPDWPGRPQRPDPWSRRRSTSLNKRPSRSPA